MNSFVINALVTACLVALVAFSGFVENNGWRTVFFVVGCIVMLLQARRYRHNPPPSHAHMLGIVLVGTFTLSLITAVVYTFGR